MDSNHVIVLNAPGVRGWGDRDKSSGASHGPVFIPVLPERGGGHSRRVCADVDRGWRRRVRRAAAAGRRRDTVVIAACILYCIRKR